MNFNALLNTIIMLFIFMAVGFVANKLGIIDEISSKRLSKLIITICQPCLIIASLAKFEYSTENLKLGFATLGLGILIHAALAVIAFLFILFTFRTPAIGIFKDPLTGTYGI